VCSSDLLTREVRRTAEYYQMQHQGSFFDRLLIIGGGAKLNNFIEHMKNQFEDMRVDVHQPLQSIEINPSLDPEFVKSVSLQLSVAVGLALYEGRI
jgi:type IV pilus assembly protein PilM